MDEDTLEDYELDLSEYETSAPPAPPAPTGPPPVEQPPSGPSPWTVTPSRRTRAETSSPEPPPQYVMPVPRQIYEAVGEVPTVRDPTYSGSKSSHMLGLVTVGIGLGVLAGWRYIGGFKGALAGSLYAGGLCNIVRAARTYSSDGTAAIVSGTYAAAALGAAGYLTYQQVK